MIEWYGKPWSEVVKNLDSSTYSGLDEDQISFRREKFGFNTIKIPKTQGIFLLFIKNLKELWLILLVLSSFLSFYLKNILSGAIGISIAIVSIMCLILNEYKHQKGFKELQKINVGIARVIRAGRTVRIPSSEVVVGDIVIVGKGEVVPADLRVVESDDLKVNEVSITGKNFIAEKYEQKIEEKQIMLSDMKNILFKSSLVVDGMGTGVVIATGMATQIANIVKLFLEEEDKLNTFYKRINSIINFVSIFVVCACFVVAVFDLLSGSAMDKVLQHSTTFLLNVIPESMVVIVILLSCILINKMKNEGAVFKDISVVERFASITSICTDKIGGFSKEKMKIEKIYACGRFLDISGENLSGGIDEVKHSNLYKIMNIVLLCNDTKTSIGKVENLKNDFMELALVKFGVENGLHKKAFDKESERILNIPFDTDRRIMTTINKVDEDHYRANVKGAVDSLLERCTHIMKNGVEIEITEEDVQAIKAADISMSNEKLSVIGVAYRSFNYEPSLKENIESNLVFAGLIGFENPLKEDIDFVIQKSNRLCVKPIMITEDNKLTALAVGQKMGLVSRLNEILSGIEMDNMMEEEFDRICGKITIFSRISANNKLKIAKVLKSYGNVVAMTGSKFIDLPILKIANIGITTSKSNIIKKIADVFLENNNMMRILNVLEDCRKIMSVLRKVVLYVITCSMSLGVFMVLSFISHYDLNNISFQGVWLNVLILILSSLAIIVQYKDEYIVSLDKEIEKRFIKENIGFSAFTALLIGASAFFILNSYYGKGAFQAEYMAYGVINITSVLFTFSFSDETFFKNIISNGIVFLNLILQILMMIFVGELYLNLFYLRGFIAIIVAWFIVCLFRKFNKEVY